jgi:hypothetical protein
VAFIVNAAKKGEQTMAPPNPVQPAIDALQELEDDFTKRIGQPGGNLNKRVRANFKTVKYALNNFGMITSMNGTIAQQSQVIAKVTTDMSRAMAKQAQEMAAWRDREQKARLAAASVADDEDDEDDIEDLNDENETKEE